MKPRASCYRAVHRAQYEFDFDLAPLRWHRLFADAPRDEDLCRASSRRLVKAFEEFYEFPLFDPQRNEWRIKRLKGFYGDYYWKSATLKFAVRGPEIPFFGLLASTWCKDCPIVYSSLITGEKPTKPRYFYEGKECVGTVPTDLANKFAELKRAGKGILRPPTSLIDRL